MDDSLFWTGVVVAAAGAVFGGIAIKVQREHRQWCEGKTRVQGVVSRLARRHRQGLPEDASGNSTGNTDLLIPMVRFRATNNIEYEVEAPEAPREVGVVFEVAYDPALPSYGRGVERVPKIAIPIFLLVLGAVLVAVGASRG